MTKEQIIHDLEVLEQMIVAHKRTLYTAGLVVSGLIKRCRDEGVFEEHNGYEGDERNNVETSSMYGPPIDQLPSDYYMDSCPVCGRAKPGDLGLCIECFNQGPNN